MVAPLPRPRVLMAGLLAASCGLLAPAQAHERGSHHDGRLAGRGPAVHFDHRYGHDRWYPPLGAAFPALPVGARAVPWGGVNWYFNAGVWLRPFGGRFVVSLPPAGLMLPLLPAGTSTLWVGGVPYYYANGVYYATAPGGYTVVAPPPGIEQAQPTHPPAAPTGAAHAVDPVVYPRNGQSAAQAEADRQDCHRWASMQPKAAADADVFQRATAACLDARGYTVR